MEGRGRSNVWRRPKTRTSNSYAAHLVVGLLLLVIVWSIVVFNVSHNSIPLNYNTAIATASELPKQMLIMALDTGQVLFRICALASDYLLAGTHITGYSTVASRRIGDEISLFVYSVAYPDMEITALRQEDRTVVLRDSTGAEQGARVYLMVPRTPVLRKSSVGITEELTVLIKPAGSPVSEIKLAGADISNGIEIGLENATNSGRFIQSYSFDPRVNFTSGTLTAVAQGNELYKCKDWNFTEQVCEGEWTNIMNVTPGDEYTVEISSDDPGFGEVVYATTSITSVYGNSRKMAYKLQTDQTVTGPINISIYGSASGSPQGLRVYLCDDNSDAPGEVIETQSDSGWTSSAVLHNITFSSSLTGGTTYWVVLQEDNDAAGSSSNVYYPRYTSTMTDAYNTKYTTNNGSSWTNYGDSVVSVYNSSGQGVFYHPDRSATTLTVQGTNNLCQSFTPASDAEANAVKIFISVREYRAGDLTINMRTGSCTGGILANATVNTSSLDGITYGFIISLNQTVSLTGGTQYYLELNSSASSSTKAYLVQALSYAPPEASYGGSTNFLKLGSTSYPTRDMIFGYDLLQIVEENRDSVTESIAGIYNSNYRIALRFQTARAGTLDNVSFYMSKASSPGNLVACLQEDSSDVPSDTNLECQELGAGNISTSEGWVSMAGWTTSLSAAAPYWFILNSTAGSYYFRYLGASKGTFWLDSKSSPAGSWQYDYGRYDGKIAVNTSTEYIMSDIKSIATTYYTYSTTYFAQSFTAPSSSDIDTLGVMTYKGATDKNLTLELRTDSGSAPSSVIIAAGNVSYSEVGSSMSLVTARLNQTVSLEQDTRYWIVGNCIGASSSSLGYYVTPAAYFNATNSYGGESELFAKSTNSGSSWTTYSDTDLIFLVGSSVSDSPPLTQEQGQTTAYVLVGANNSLWAQGKDTTSLGWAWLETNESGSWLNWTSGVYGSPADMGGAVNTWTTANFSWMNASINTATGIGWRIWFNDSNNNQVATSVMVFTITPDNAPEWQSQVQTSSTLMAGDNNTLSAEGKDETSLAYAWLETNETGAWLNWTGGVYGSPASLGGTANEWTNATFYWQNASIASSLGIGWRIWFNDSGGNKSVTNITTFTVSDGVPVSQNQGQTSSAPLEGMTNNLWAQGKDAVSLESAWLETNETGAWLNWTGGVYSSPADMGSTVNTWTTANFSWMNASISSSTSVGWRIWFEDNLGGQNVTSDSIFTLSEPLWQETTYSDFTDPAVNHTTTEADNNYEWVQLYGYYAANQTLNVIQNFNFEDFTVGNLDGQKGWISFPVSQYAIGNATVDATYGRTAMGVNISWTSDAGGWGAKVWNLEHSWVPVINGSYVVDMYVPSYVGLNNANGENYDVLFRGYQSGTSRIICLNRYVNSTHSRFECYNGTAYATTTPVVYPTHNAWHNYRIDWFNNGTNDYVDFYYDGTLIETGIKVQADFSSIDLNRLYYSFDNYGSNPPKNRSVFLDNVKVYADSLQLYNLSGNYTSSEVIPAILGQWGTLTINKSEPDATNILRVDVLNGATNTTIAGFTDITTNGAYDLSNISTGNTTLRLRAKFSGDGTGTAILYDWSVNYSVTAPAGDTTPPTWQNQGQTTATPAMTTNNSLWAQGRDETSLEWAWLETNETGVWRNYTGGDYGSPANMGSTVNTWTTANFSWYNTSVIGDTGIGWRIWFNDSSGNRNVTDTMLFVMQPTMSISIVNSHNIVFGSMSRGESDNTTDNSPLPFVVRNDGNYHANITIQATSLWNTSTNPTANFQFRSAENETSSVWNTVLDLISAFTNIPLSGSPTRAVSNLNHTDVKDEVRLDINITAPSDEPPTTKSSTVTILGSQA